MLYDEEKREEQDQFHRRGDYSPHNPDLAVQNTGHGPMSTENQLLMMTRVCIKLQEQNKALLAALDRLRLEAIHYRDNGVIGSYLNDALRTAEAAITACEAGNPKGSPATLGRKAAKE